jgi:hypothetical protein
MPLDFFRVSKKGIDIDYQTQWLCGSGAPGGSTTDSALVEPSSLYTDTAGTDLYQKIGAGAGLDKWLKIAKVGEDLSVENSKRIDEPSGGGFPKITYFGRAAPGALESASVWLIQEITELNSEGDTDIKYANGVALFDQAWDDRLIITYT